MWRAAIVVCLFWCKVSLSAGNCTGKQTLAELSQCLGKNPEAHQECIGDDSTMEQILACLVKFNYTSTDPDNSTHIVYESPLDQITDVDNLDSWLAAQHWRYFLSEIGRPGTRQVKDVWISYLTVTASSGCLHPCGSKGAMLVAIGGREQVDNYDETLRNFLNMGYSPIYAITHRGKGRSDRLLSDPFKAYVEASDDYVKDFRQFVDITRAEMAASSTDSNKPLFFFCHSTGCAIGISYLIQEYEYQRPNVFNAVVTAAPLFKPVTDPFPYGVAVSLVEVMSFFGQSQGYAPTSEESVAKFDDNTCMWFPGPKGSISRCLRVKRRCREYLNQTVGRDNHKGLCNGGVTSSLAKELFDLYGDTYPGFLATEGKKIVPPILMQQSGDPDGTDGVVFNPEAAGFCQKGCATCTLLSYPNAVHTIHYNVDAVYFQLLTKFDEFFQQHRGVLVPQARLPDHIKGEGEACNNDLDCYSRYCDADFAFDVFGGTCQNDTSVVTISSAPSRSSLSIVALTMAAVIALLFAQ